jgi:type VI secretion system protein ImpL
MMRTVLRALGSTVGIVLVVTAVLSVLLWLFGGFLGFGDQRPFESTLGLVIGLGGLWLIALVIVLIALVRAERREKTLTEEITATADVSAPSDPGIGDEIAELRGKLKTALTRLRRAKGGRRALSELPWYVMIGPPGAGKTTAIVNSGLQFPLADDLGAGAIGGVGGTRNCDWWFTNEAVLVDTAGRYTTQESDAAADNAGWLAFLDLLKKHRRRQPINGAMVAISLSDLAMQDALTQKAHAGAVRRRLHELRERLGVRFPVYVLFTKADLIAGFTESFERLSKEEREQVWGFTLPLPKGREAPQPAAAFEEEFGLLLARLNAQSLERIQTETDPQRRGLIAGFPAQFASIRPVAQSFLTEVFQENRFEHRQMLRGVYFTSGTQEGTPIDRLMMGMARTFGIGRQAIGSGRGTGRSYFLTRLFSDVVFPESGLVSADDRVERRYRWTQRAAIAATVLIAVGVGAVWASSYRANLAFRDSVAASVAAYRGAAAEIPGSPVGDSDLLLVAPALEHLRAIPGVRDGEVEIAGTGWGLDQSGVIVSEARQTYRAALNRHFLPRLLLQLEEQMQSSINDPVQLFDVLKVYLMLGLAGPMDQDMVRGFLVSDWERTYAGASRQELRSALADNLDALLSQPMRKIDLNADLVGQVQDVLTRMPQAQRIYNGIVQTTAARALPQWRLTDIGGPAISRAFSRSSGKPLNEGIEGIYTHRGFHEVFLDEALRVSAQIRRDAFVLGPAAAQDPSEAAQLALSRDVLELYFNDFVARYDGILADLDIVPLESPSHAVEVTNVLSGPASPMRKVLEAIDRETRLTEERADADAAPADALTDAAAGAAAATEGAAATPTGKLLTGIATSRLSSDSRKLLDALMEADAGSGKGRPVGAYVEDRFQPIHDLVTRVDDQPAPIDGLLDALVDVNKELNKLVFSGGAALQQQGGSPAIQTLMEIANRLPGPIQRWATQIVSGSSGITADGTRSAINARWQSEVLPFCEKATGNTYPFDRRAKADIGLQDFATLFGPGGLIDRFFQETLAEHVDQRTRPWSLKKLNDTDLGISPEVLQQLQFAAEIRDAFFAGGTTPKVQFQITPEALDPKASAIILEVDAQLVGFSHADSQPRPTPITWPGTVGLARVLMEPAAAASESSLVRDGPWGWFRLLDAAELRKTNVSDRSRLIFNVGGRLAIFQMQSSSVLNPFTLPALSKFSCPKSF